MFCACASTCIMKTLVESAWIPTWLTDAGHRPHSDRRIVLTPVSAEDRRRASGTLRRYGPSRTPGARAERQRPARKTEATRVCVAGAARRAHDAVLDRGGRHAALRRERNRRRCVRLGHRRADQDLRVTELPFQ